MLRSQGPTKNGTGFKPRDSDQNTGGGGGNQKASGREMEKGMQIETDMGGEKVAENQMEREITQARRPAPAETPVRNGKERRQQGLS